MLSRRPGERPSKHTKPNVRLRLIDGEPAMVVEGNYSTTKRRPWALRADNRRRNRQARAARKANRG